MEEILAKSSGCSWLLSVFLPSGTWIRLLESSILKRNEERWSQRPEPFIYLIKHYSLLPAVVAHFIP